MAIAALTEKTDVLWLPQKLVVAETRRSRGKAGRSWEDDTVKLPRLVPGEGSAADTIVLEEGDLEDVMELAALDPPLGPPLLSLGTAGGAEARREGLGGVGRRLRVALKGLLFRLGWAHLDDELEGATRLPTSG